MFNSMPKEIKYNMPFVTQAEELLGAAWSLNNRTIGATVVEAMKQEDGRAAQRVIAELSALKSVGIEAIVATHATHLLAWSVLAQPVILSELGKFAKDKTVAYQVLGIWHQIVMSAYGHSLTCEGDFARVAVRGGKLVMTEHGRYVCDEIVRLTANRQTHHVLWSGHAAREASNVLRNWQDPNIVIRMAEEEQEKLRAEEERELRLLNVIAKKHGVSVEDARDFGLKL